jgi:hypothetical protein
VTHEPPARAPDPFEPGARAPGSSDGKPVAAPDSLPTYQQLLDAALELTFPASDPIAAEVARRAERAVKTARDATDWTVVPEHREAT